MISQETIAQISALQRLKYQRLQVTLIRAERSSAAAQHRKEKSDLDVNDAVESLVSHLTSASMDQFDLRALASEYEMLLFANMKARQFAERKASELEQSRVDMMDGVLESDAHKRWRDFHLRTLKKNDEKRLSRVAEDLFRLNFILKRRSE